MPHYSPQNETEPPPKPPINPTSLKRITTNTYFEVPGWPRKLSDGLFFAV